LDEKGGRASMKKSITIFIASVILLCLFFTTACGQQSNKPDDNSGYDGTVWGKLAIDFAPKVQVSDDEMVDISDWIPSLYIELMYATNDNFTGEVIYDFSSAYLRYGTVKKLIDVQKRLNQQGYSLKICDAFRPVSAQFKLWEVVPDPKFVADPYHGYSTHSRGNTVDLTLVTITGEPVEMPTEVDTFSLLADRDYSDVSDEAARNAMILQNAMVDAGFKTNSKEWWHYYDTVSYPVAVDFVPVD
jgi:zinc D-Ala-D-Ala dipeptidase